MTAIRLTGGAYEARSYAAAAQRCVNLYAEPLPQNQGEPAPAACYPTPGLRLCYALPDAPIRGIRQASNGRTYAVAGSGVYLLNANASTYSLLGRITPGTAPVSLAENTIDLVIVDGSPTGWHITLANDAFGVITDPTGTFRGGSSAGYLDTYLLFSIPGTPQFHSSDSLSLTFDPLWFANLSAQPDLLVSLAVAKREIWLIGQRSTEVFYDAGGADFPFQSMQGVFIDHGTAAVNSVVVLDNAVYWLSRTRRGEGIVVRGAGYQATRVSTYAIESEISSYDDISDAIGMSYMLNGHMFYLLTFPSADKTWMFDITTGLWSELCWLDGDGVEHRHRANCLYLCGDEVLVGDWENGNVYALDTNVYTDNGAPIKRLRHFPHEEADGKRVFHRMFIADMQCGEAQPGDYQVFLSWSNDRGRSFGNPVGNSLGLIGNYLVQPQWQRLGLSRSRVYAVEWACACPTALLGAFLEATPGSS
jgi:hypothetical protein